jgi:hypothetical protein
MKKFANSLFKDPQKTGPFYGPWKGPPKKGSKKGPLCGLSFRHFFGNLKAHLKLVFQIYVRTTLEYNRTPIIMESQ